MKNMSVLLYQKKSGHCVLRSAWDSCPCTWKWDIRSQKKKDSATTVTSMLRMSST